MLDRCLDCRWRGDVHNRNFMAWKTDSVERIDYEWVELFPHEPSKYINWRGYSKVCLGFPGWSTAAEKVNPQTPARHARPMYGSKR